MIDLHLHLDGSLEPQFLQVLANEQKKEITLQEIQQKTICPTSCKSLNDYLQCFDLPLELLQTEDSLMQATYHLVERLERQNMLYAEIRFAPMLHTRQGLSIRQVITAVITALNEANRCFNVKSQIILCCMRGGVENKLQNIQTIEEGSRFLGKGVVAIDLAGAEALYKTKDFEYLFTIAKGVNMPFVIHAGESDGVDSVKYAVDFGAKRIGHGIALQDSIELMQFVSKNQIAIEMCLSSNLQTKAIKEIEDFPVKKYLDFGILVTINTDNMTVSNTTIEKEFYLMEKSLNLGKEVQKKLLSNSVRASFLSEADKAKLMLKVLDRLKY